MIRAKIIVKHMKNNYLNSDIHLRKKNPVVLSLNRAGGVYGRILRSWAQTECSEVCAHNQGQDSPIQTN